MNELIRCNEKELEELRSISTSLPGTDYSKEKVQTTPTGDATYTNVVLKIVELEETIKVEIEKLLKLKLEIRNVINTVRDNEERLLLKLRYLNFMTWDEVCYDMKVSMRTALRIHVRALNNVKVPEC